MRQWIIILILIAIFGCAVSIAFDVRYLVDERVTRVTEIHNNKEYHIRNNFGDMKFPGNTVLVRGEDDGK